MDCACKSSSGPQTAGQCQPGLPGGGDLPRPVLSLAPAAGALWAGRRASAPAPGAARPAGAAGAGDRAAAAERGGQRRDLGREPDRGVPAAALAAARGPQHRAAGPAARGAGDAPAAADRARASRPADGGLAHRAHAPRALAAPSTASRATSRPASPASWCAWTPSTSGSSRAWARSGRSRPAMPRAPTAWRGCCRPTPPRRPLTSCAGSCVPLYRRAGWRLRRVLTDGGPEFKGAFDEACRALGLRHTRTKPRHAWTNGFVERLQGTILQEHWRVAFRRRYFTSRTALQRSLEAFMQSYNHERPHQGYRLRGRTPAALFWGAARA